MTTGHRPLATGGGKLPPRVVLEVDEPGGTGLPLGADTNRLITSVGLHQIWDGADELTVNFNAWDHRRSRSAIIDDPLFAHGNSMFLRAGYGQDVEVLGRFTITDDTPSYEGSPTTAIIGDDGLALLMDDTWPGDYGNEVRTYSDVALIIARKFGLGFAGDVSRAIPHRTRTRKGKDGQTRTIKTKIIKNAGDPDLKMLKDMADAGGLAWPKVRYVEAGSRLARAIPDDYALAERFFDRDVLFFAAIDMQRQKREGLQAAKLIRIRRDGMPSTMEGFSPTESTSNIPMAVRVTGYVKGPPAEVVVAEAEIADAAMIRRRSAYLREAAGASTEIQRDLALAKAEKILGEIRVDVSYRRASKGERKSAAMSHGGALLDVLGSDRNPAMAFDHAKGVKVQTLRREVLNTVPIVASAEQLGPIARYWLLTRMQLRQGATATLRNIPGSHLIYPNQIHECVLESGRFDGYYMVRECNQDWTGADHTVSLQLQRVAEAPTRLSVTTRKVE